MPTETITVDAILFDMDGTLIDSTPGVLKAWAIFSKTYHFDPVEAANASHGRRLLDSLKDFCKTESEPEISGQKLQDEIMRFERAVIGEEDDSTDENAPESKLGGQPQILPGVERLLRQLKLEQIASDKNEPRQRWTIVTSASSWYTPRALQICGIPLPKHFITADDIPRGKPHPDPYLKGAEACEADPKNCLVVEDAPSGLIAGFNAGARTLAVCTSHGTRENLMKELREALVRQGKNFEERESQDGFIIRQDGPDSSDPVVFPTFVVQDLTHVSAQYVGEHQVEVIISL